MEDEIVRLLQASMSHEEGVRTSAEQSLTVGGTHPGFGLGLARVVLTQTLPIGTRQLAAIVLKKYVKEHWQEGEGQFVPPQTADEEKAAIRHVLPAGLGDPVGKIRTAVGMAIGSIATWDWPHQWPELTGTLLGAIKDRRSEDHVVGALQCLAMIAGDMEEAQVPEVVPFLFPELLAIASADATAYGVDLKRRALAVMHSCLLALGMMSGARQRAVRDLMTPLLPPWLDVFAATLAAPPAAHDPHHCGLVLETLKCLSQVVQFFSKVAGDALLSPLGRAAALFHAVAPAYHAVYVGPGAEDHDLVSAADGGDGEAMSLEGVVSQLLELVMTLVEHPRLSHVLASGLDALVYQAVGYMCMTAAQEEAWENDANQYVADEDDDMATVRASCGMLLDELADRFENDALTALARAVERRLLEADQARAAGDPTWWKHREATLLAVGTLNDIILETEAAAKETGSSPAPFSSEMFLSSVLDVDLAADRADVPAFLRGRALWVAARLAPGAPQAASTAVLRASLAALAPGAAAPLRVGACRALSQYVPLAPRDVLQPFLGPAYQALGELLSSAGVSHAEETPEETLHLVLEAMLVLVKSDDAAAATWAGALAPATLKVWAEKVADPLLAADAREVLEALAAVPACLPGLHQMAVPTLAGVLAAPDAQPPMLVESTLDLLAGLLRPAAPAEARATHAACFRHVVALAVRSDDAGVLQSAAECLRAMLRSGGEASLTWGTDGNGGGGDVLRAYLDAAARLLSPDLEDGGALFAAPLLGQMLRRLPAQMAPLLPEIVKAVVTRVKTARQPNLIAALLAVFARLAHVDANALVSLLAGMPAPGGETKDDDDGVPSPTSALELVMRAWTSYQPDVQGAFDIKLTTSALALLLQTGNPALFAVGVRGELKVGTSETGGGAPRTRSRAKAAGPDVYTVVPLPGKILELLADALLEAQEAAAAGGEDDDEWESDEEDEEDGEGGGQGGGGGGFLGGGFGGDLLERLLNKGIDEVEDDDADEAEDPISAIDTTAYLGERLRALHAAGHLAPLAAGLNQRRQRALMTLLQ